MKVAASLLVVALAYPCAGSAPPLQPVIQSIFPRGARQGSETVISIRGKYLEGATALRVSGAGVNAEILNNTESEIKARIRVDGRAGAYRRDLRVFTPNGSFVQAFDIGALPETTEAEPNNDPAKAQSLELPSVVNGRIPAGDYDYFRFRAEAGQTLVFDLSSSRVGTRFDAALSLADGTGREIAFEDDSFFDKDPRLIHRFDRAGEYVLRVSGFREGGSAAAEYRLVMGGVPYARYLYPAGGRRGSQVTVSFTGVNLSRADGLEMDGQRVPVYIVDRKPERLIARLSLPSSLDPGMYRIRLKSGDVELPGALPFVVSDFEEIVLNGTPVSKPVALDPVRVVNGIIAQPKQADEFWIEAGAGDRVMLQGDAMSLGNFLDPAVTIYDSAGKALAFMDEAAPNGFDKEPPTVDFHLAHRFERAGRYRIEFRDAGMRGHESFVYRLLIGRADPRFEVHTLTNQLSASPGQTALLPVRVKRTAGWDTPVEVWVEGLPARVESKRVTAEPVNTHFRGTFSEDFFFDGTNVELPVQVHTGAPSGAHVLRVRARGTRSGKTIEQHAAVWYPWQQTGYLRGPGDDQEFVLTIGSSPWFDLEGPATIKMTPGKSKDVSLGVRWMGKSAPFPGIRVEAGRMPAGVRIERFSVSPAHDQITVSLRAEGTPAEGSAWLSLVGTAETAGETYRKSTPDIEVIFVEEEGHAKH